MDQSTCGPWGERESGWASKSWNGNTEILPSLPPLSCIKGKLQTQIRVDWEDEWISYNEARQTKQFYPYFDSNRSKTLHKLSRIRLGQIVRLTTGHNNNLNYHYSLCNPVNIYRFCQWERETFFHLLTNCPAFLDSRYSVLGTIWMWCNGLGPKYTLKILSYSSYQQCNRILKWSRDGFMEWCPILECRGWFRQQLGPTKT